MNHTRLSWVGVIGALMALSTCRGGCHRGDDRAATVEGRLALFPAATRIVASIDVAKLRASPAAAKLAAQASRNPDDQRQIEDFARRTHFDPMRQLNSVTVAFPEEARARGELGMVLRADGLDESRLVAYVRDQLQKGGDDLTATSRGRLTLWSSRRNPDMVGFFLDDHTFVLGAGGWGPKMAELAQTARPGDSAATDLDLVNLVERAASSHDIWAAAMVPEPTRKSLSADPRFADAANIQTLSAGLNLGKGLEAVLHADLSTAPQARALADRVTGAVVDAKKNPEVLMLGLGPYLNGVTASAAERGFDLHAGLDEAAFNDLIGRLAGLMALARGGGGSVFSR